MAAWLDEYLLALRERDRAETAEKNLYDTYTRLADRTATLNFQPATQQGQSPQATLNSASGEQSPGAERQLKEADRHALKKVQEDLSEAQRSRRVLQIQLADLVEEAKTLRRQSRSDSRSISQLQLERDTLIRGIRDREEELKGKTKLLEDVHDETVSLTLQLNMAEEKCRKLERENKELVDRWMARMGEEADAMNNASRFS